MRRSFISTTTVNRIMAAQRKREKDARDRELIAASQSALKELPPHYELSAVVFDPDTRMTKIQFVETKHYRTIERYITKNHVKYPIYSDWKEKSKTISRSLKLTNEELESLECNEDSLISQFARYIVVNLNDEDLYPSWFIADMLENEYDKVCSKAKQDFEKFKKEKQEIIQNAEYVMGFALLRIDRERTKQDELIQLKDKYQGRLDKIMSAPKSVWRSILTLGIYNFYKSGKRQTKFKEKICLIENQIQKILAEMEFYSNEKKEGELLLKKTKKELEQAQNDLNELLEKEEQKHKEKLQSIKPLEDNACVGDDSFMPLKMFIGITYEKIVGCYVIRNREKDKYYVGQSKDVLRRIKQHFKGTVPNNVIFAEDYYTSLQENKEDLFEVKIISCQTKDELDQMEKQLISKYNAFERGYNGTNGNN